MNSNNQEYEEKIKLFEKEVNDMNDNLLKSAENFKILSIFMTIILLLIGYYSSALFNDWMNLARSGSVIVIWGIFVAYCDLSGKISNTSTVYESQVSLSQVTPNKRVEELLGSVHNTSMEVKSKFLRMEFILLVLGTIVWGFGDCLGKLV